MTAHSYVFFRGETMSASSIVLFLPSFIGFISANPKMDNETNQQERKDKLPNFPQEHD